MLEAPEDVVRVVDALPVTAIVQYRKAEHDGLDEVRMVQI